MMNRTKLVNIYPSMPITTVNPPIRSVVKKVTKSIKEIRACLMARAIVEEVLPDGKTVRLNISNYDQISTEASPVMNTNKCACGGACDDCVDVSEPKNTEGKSVWQIEYDKFIAEKGVNGMMTRKQRRSLEAAARAAADAAVAKNTESDVVMGVASIETSEAPEVIEEVEELVDETPVETLDVETELIDTTNDVVEEEITEVVEEVTEEEVETAEETVATTDEVTE